ncbi:MAG: hypothetical protein K1X53_07945 [Candidatus Sumerlaeaceae bacterium]|nr:hypothetical protein [Candidatus Sumerlaeaceae bacterium]
MTANLAIAFPDRAIRPVSQIVSPQSQARISSASVLLALLLFVHSWVPSTANAALGGLRNDTWAYSMVGQNWQLLTPEGLGPPLMNPACAIYDPLRDRVVVVGTWDSNSSVKAAWVYECSTGQWSSITLPAGSFPIPSLMNNGMHLDMGQHRAILVTVNTGIYAMDLDTWLITYISDTTDAAVAGSFAASAYDSTRNRIIRYGGLLSSSSVSENLWICDLATTAPGSRWSQVPKSGTWPGPRWEVTSVYDPGRDRMILFGGRQNVITGPVIYSDLTFELNPGDNQWTTVPVQRAPVRRGHYSVCWNSNLNRMHLYGGIFHETAAYITTFDDLWTYRPAGPDWRVAAPRGSLPISRRMAATAYDSLRNRIVMFGGQFIEISQIQCRATVILPRNGAIIRGNRVLVAADLTSGTTAQLTDVKFQYRTSSFDESGQPVSPGPWQDMIAATPGQHPNPDSTFPYFIHWDVSGFSRQLIDIMAVAKGVNGQSDPVPPVNTILVDGSSNRAESSGLQGTEPEVQAVASAGQSLDIGTAAATGDANMIVRVNGEDLISTVALSIVCRTTSSTGLTSAEGLGHVFDIATSTPSGLSVRSVPTFDVIASYPDSDNDGVVDNTTISESELGLATVVGNTINPVIGAYKDTTKNTISAGQVPVGRIGLFVVTPAAVSEWSLYD